MRFFCVYIFIVIGHLTAPFTLTAWLNTIFTIFTQVWGYVVWHVRRCQRVHEQIY